MIMQQLGQKEQVSSMIDASVMQFAELNVVRQKNKINQALRYLRVIKDV